MFRRRWGTVVWHWSSKCSDWPRALECEERKELPRRGEFCNECRVRDPSDLVGGIDRLN
jgi:hypothetical protein